MSEALVTPAVVRCTSCATELAPALLACPACRTLVHRERLAALAREAEAAGAANDFARATELWREALALLPPDSKQYEQVAARVDQAAAALEGKTAEEMRRGPSTGSRLAKILAPLGIAGLLIWKLKFVFVALATKGKLLLVGLTKMSTIGSLFVSLGVYWTAWGWKFAAAILGGIYIHEMGHFAAMRRRGMAADAPMFVPGIGAFVRMHSHAATPGEDARIGLAGPVWGLGAGLAAFAVAIATGSKFWFAVAHITAVINLFNLTPVWQLDGSRAFHAFTRTQRWMAVVALIAAWALSREGMLLVPVLVAIWRAFEKRVTAVADWPAFVTYAGLAGAFAALSLSG